jgi:hypothetical protein
VKPNVELTKSMHKIISVTLSLFFLFISGCDHAKQARGDFLEKANIFWNLAISHNYNQIEEMVD